MSEQMTFKYMVDFLNANRNRKIQLIKVHVKNFNGLKHSEITNLVDSATRYFSRSLAREMKRQRETINLKSKVGNFDKPIQKFLIR